ncbi:hypothetical protein CU280_19535 [Yersinia mollaretii]|nr:hypothetical protein CU280_19535 [Yersinia mollaretii]
MLYLHGMLCLALYFLILKEEGVELFQHILFLMYLIKIFSGHIYLMFGFLIMQVNLWDYRLDN